MDPNPDDSRALYQRVLDDIRAQIDDRRLKPGMRMPSAKELTAHYGVAHMTVQRALQELKHEGLIFSIQGKGTYVHPRAKFHNEPPAEAREPLVIDRELTYYVHRERVIDRIEAYLLDIQLAEEQGDRPAEAQARRVFFEQLAAMVPEIIDLANYEKSYPDRDKLAKHDLLYMRVYPGNLAQDRIDGTMMTTEQIDAYYGEQAATEAAERRKARRERARRTGPEQPGQTSG
jgi:DNA-binding transcriptional regulator YhcF (GntR family)